MINKTDKVRVEQIFVVKQGLAATAPLNPKGTKFSNGTASAITVNGNTFQAGEVMLETGQLGIYGASSMEAIDATSTIATDSSIVIAVKRDESADSVSVPAKPFEISNPISAQNGIVFTGTAYTSPLNNVIALGSFGSQGVITALDETIYRISVAYNGRRTDMLNGRNTPVSYMEFTTPDYTTLALNAVNARDHLLNGIAYSGLVDSVAYKATGNEAVPIAIDTQGVGTGVLISSLTAGQTITLGKNSAGELFNLKLSESVVASLKATLDSSTGPLPAATTKIILVDKTVMGTGASNVDMLLILATDQGTAAFDKIAETKTRIKVGLSKGFLGTASNLELIKPLEGEGSGRNWRMYYESTAGLRRFDSSELSGLDGGSIHYATPVSASGKYSVYTIMHADVAAASNGAIAESPLVSIVLVETADTASKGAIQAVLNPYFKSSPFASFDGETDATGVVIA